MKILPEQRIRPRIQQLARLASVGHSDIALVRDIITTKIDRRWLGDNIDRLSNRSSPQLRTKESFGGLRSCISSWAPSY
jgi:hypothetical protein